MGETTEISWADATWNPWRGCAKVSSGCANCYMFRDQERYGRDPSVVVRSKTTFDAPLKWEPSIVFTCSWSDWFIEDADPWRDEAWDVIRRTPQHVYLILSKRLELAPDRLPPDWPLPNVWIGTSIENARHSFRADLLRALPAERRFISAEPLLGPLYPCVGLTSGESPDAEDAPRHPDAGSIPAGSINTASQIDSGSAPESVDDAQSRGAAARGRAPLNLADVDWLIVGGESGGRDVRPMHPEWARDLRDAALAADIAFHFKQWGSWVPVDQTDTMRTSVWTAVTAAGRIFTIADASETPGACCMRYAGPGPDSGGRFLDGREHLDRPEIPATALF